MSKVNNELDAKIIALDARRELNPTTIRAAKTQLLEQGGPKSETRR